MVRIKCLSYKKILTIRKLGRFYSKQMLISLVCLLFLNSLIFQRQCKLQNLFHIDLGQVFQAAIIKEEWSNWTVRQSLWDQTFTDLWGNSKIQVNKQVSAGFHICKQMDQIQCFLNSHVAGSVPKCFSSSVLIPP